MSIAVTPLLGLALNYTPFGIRLTLVLNVLSVFTIALAISACARRSRIPEADTKLDKILTAVLIISIILAISMTVYVIAVPKGGEKFTEFYVLGSSARDV